MDEWIDSDEKKPGYGHICFICLGDYKGKVIPSDMAVYLADGWHWWLGKYGIGDGIYSKVSYWKPVPEVPMTPPKE